MGVFSTREISIFIWTAIIISLFMIMKDTRIIIINGIKLLLKPGPIKILLIYFLYITIITIFMSKLSLWNWMYIKDIIIWSIFVGSINYVKSIIDDNFDFNLITILKDNMNVTIIVEFIISIFTFDIKLELVIVPIATIFSICNFYIEQNEKYESLSKISNTIMGGFGLYLALKTIEVGINEYKYLNLKYTLVSFAIPIIYLLLSIPMYYIIRLYSKYETVFVSMPFGYGINPRIKRRRLYKIFRVCGFSIKKLEHFYKYHIPNISKSMPEEDFDKVLNSFELNFRKNMNRF